MTPSTPLPPDPPSWLWFAITAVTLGVIATTWAVTTLRHRHDRRTTR